MKQTSESAVTQRKAFCTLCRREFSNGLVGESDLTRHAFTGNAQEGHTTVGKGASNIGAFFVTSTDDTSKPLGSTRHQSTLHQSLTSL